MTYHIPNLGGCYLDAPEIPTQVDALAACTPTDSPWRRVARVGGR